MEKISENSLPLPRNREKTKIFHSLLKSKLMTIDHVNFKPKSRLTLYGF